MSETPERPERAGRPGAPHRAPPASAFCEIFWPRQEALQQFLGGLLAVKSCDFERWWLGARRSSTARRSRSQRSTACHRAYGSDVFITGTPFCSLRRRRHHLQPPATSAPTIVRACSNAPAGIGKHVDGIRIGSCLDAGVELLSKPYRREQLAAKVRRVLDSAAGEPRKAAETERVLQSSACDFVPAEPFAKSIVGLILRLGCAPSPGCSSAQPIGYRSPKIVS